VYFSLFFSKKVSMLWSYTAYESICRPFTTTASQPICVIFQERLLKVLSGPGSSVGIATCYGLAGLGSNPGGATFSAPVQTGLGAHPASCTMGTGSFLGVKSGRGLTLTPHPF